jgi:uncharacterized membrane protein
MRGVSHRQSRVGSRRPEPADRDGSDATPSGGSGRRRLLSGVRARFRIKALKPVTYSLMHLMVAISVAYALTRDWRIALGVGVIEPMVQTVAYMLHEKAWSRTARPNPEQKA